MTNNIPEEILKNICKIGEGKDCCRYIIYSSNGFECVKHTSLKKTIDDKVSFMVAQGDNCKGLV